MQASPAFRQLATYATRELERIFRAGDTPSLGSITGFEYRGYNYPPLMALLRSRTFIKGFVTNAQGVVYGYNTPVRQNGLAGTWQALPDEGSPKRFGFFRVVPVQTKAGDNRHFQALLLDYGRGDNPWYDITQVLRDYLVRVKPGSDDLLLGKAYLTLGPLRLPGSFFLLERHRPVPVDRSVPRG